MHDRPMTPMPKRLFEFDDWFTAPLAGFSGADEYYRVSSSIDDLANIRTRTLIVADRRDPVVPFGMFADCQLSPVVRLIETTGGGHIGYVSRRGIDPSRFWIGRRICDWLNRSGSSRSDHDA